MTELTFHAPAPDDFEAMHAMASDWQVVRQLGRWAWPVDTDQVRSFCKPFEGDGLVWTIKENGRFAGRVGVTGGAIGYTLPQSAHGRGIATRASRFAIAHAFDLLELETIHGSTWHDNRASARVLEKLGFDHWQTHYDHARARGLPVLIHQFRLTRSTWDRLSAAAK